MILVVPEDGFQTRIRPGIELARNSRSRGPVVHAGRRDHDRQDQAERVNDQVTFPPVNFLGGVVAVFAADLGGLDGLAVDATGAGCIRINVILRAD